MLTPQTGRGDPPKRRSKRTTTTRPAPPLPKETEDTVKAAFQKVYTGRDPRTAKSTNISVKRIVSGDPKYIDESVRFQDLTTREWVGEVNLVLLAAMRFIARAATEANVKNPRAIMAVAGALKIVNEADLTRRVIDAKLAEYYKPYGGPDFPLPAPIQRGRAIIQRQPIDAAERQ